MFNFVNALNALRITVWIAVGVLIVLRITSRYIAKRTAEDSPLMTVVNAANSVKANVWAVVILVFGVLLNVFGDRSDGGMLVAGGLALMQHGQSQQDPLQATTAPADKLIPSAPQPSAPSAEATTSPKA